MGPEKEGRKWSNLKIGLRFISAAKQNQKDIETHPDNDDAEVLKVGQPPKSEKKKYSQVTAESKRESKLSNEGATDGNVSKSPKRGNALKLIKNRLFSPSVGNSSKDATTQPKDPSIFDKIDCSTPRRPSMLRPPSRREGVAETPDTQTSRTVTPLSSHPTVQPVLADNCSIVQGKNKISKKESLALTTTSSSSGTEPQSEIRRTINTSYSDDSEISLSQKLMIGRELIEQKSKRISSIANMSMSLSDMLEANNRRYDDGCRSLTTGSMPQNEYPKNSGSVFGDNRSVASMPFPSGSSIPKVVNARRRGTSEVSKTRKNQQRKSRQERRGSLASAVSAVTMDLPAIPAVSGDSVEISAGLSPSQDNPSWKRNRTRSKRKESIPKKHKSQPVQRRQKEVRTGYDAEDHSKSTARSRQGVKRGTRRSRSSDGALESPRSLQRKCTEPDTDEKTESCLRSPSRRERSNESGKRTEGRKEKRRGRRNSRERSSSNASASQLRQRKVGNDTKEQKRSSVDSLSVASQQGVDDYSGDYTSHKVLSKATRAQRGEEESQRSRRRRSMSIDNQSTMSTGPGGAPKGSQRSRRRRSISTDDQSAMSNVMPDASKERQGSRRRKPVSIDDQSVVSTSAGSHRRRSILTDDQSLVESSAQATPRRRRSRHDGEKKDDLENNSTSTDHLSESKASVASPSRQHKGSSVRQKERSRRSMTPAMLNDAVKSERGSSGSVHGEMPLAKPDSPTKSRSDEAHRARSPRSNKRPRERRGHRSHQQKEQEPPSKHQLSPMTPEVKAPRTPLTTSQLTKYAKINKMALREFQSPLLGPPGNKPNSDRSTKVESPERKPPPRSSSDSVAHPTDKDQNSSRKATLKNHLRQLEELNERVRNGSTKKLRSYSWSTDVQTPNNKSNNSGDSTSCQLSPTLLPVQDDEHQPQGRDCLSTDTANTSPQVSEHDQGRLSPTNNSTSTRRSTRKRQYAKSPQKTGWIKPLSKRKDETFKEPEPDHSHNVGELEDYLDLPQNLPGDLETSRGGTSLPASEGTAES